MHEEGRWKFDHENCKNLVFGIEYDPISTLENLIKYMLQLEIDDINVTKIISTFVGVKNLEIKKYANNLQNCIDPEIYPDVGGIIW